MSQYFDSVYKDSQISTETKLFENTSKEVFFNGCFDKNQVKLLVSWFLSKYGEKKTIDFLEKLKYMGFHKATQAGISLGLEDLEIPPDKSSLIGQATAEMDYIDKQSSLGALTSVEKSQSLIDTWNQTSELLRQNAVQNFKNRNCVNPVYMMAFSGARGNISQVRQLVAMRGLMADPQGAILEFPIQSNFREGLTITEYLISCYGARKGLVDTALRTATSGYLTRRLVDSAQHAVIAMTDCNTKNGIKLIGKNLETRLIGRVLANQVKITNNLIFERNHLISSSSAKILCNYFEQILIRSPLTCDSQTTVCKMCYGSNLATGKLVTLGEAVGVIAAQSIGEPGTQLTMRTFHTGGVGVFSDQAIKPIFAPYDGKIDFIENLSGHFVRTPYGNIRYMVKYIPQNPNKLLIKVRPDIPGNSEFCIYEKDLPSGSLLVVKQGELVKTHQLIAQASQLKITKQKLPESSHPVYSPVEGQVFFESMNVSVENENVNSTEFISSSLSKIEKNIETEASKIRFGLDKVRGLPDTRTMSKIGSFWVLAGHNQYEVHSSESFIYPGDLVSPTTLLFQYNFYSSNETQIKKFKNNLGLGYFAFEIPLISTNFNRGIYRFHSKKTENDTFVYKSLTSDSFSADSLIWFINPLSKDKARPVKIESLLLSYIYTVSEYIDTEYELNENIDKNSSSRLTNFFTNVQGIIFNLNHPINIVKTINNYKKVQSKKSKTTNLKRLQFVNSKSFFKDREQKKCYIYTTFQNYNNNLVLFHEKKFEITDIRQNNFSKFTTNPLSSRNLKISKDKARLLIFLKNKKRVFNQKFVINSVEHTLTKFFNNQPNFYIQEKNGWIYFPSRNFKAKDQHFLKRKLIKNSNILDGISIPKSYLSYEYIPSSHLLIKKVNKKNLNSSKRTISPTWYNSEILLNPKIQIKKLDINKYNLIGGSNYCSHVFTNTQTCKPRVWYKNKKYINLKNSFNQIISINKLKPKRNIFEKNILFLNFTRLYESNLFEYTILKKRWATLNVKNTVLKPQSPLFSKQYSTKLTKREPKVVDFLICIPHLSDWSFLETFIRINVTLPAKSLFINNKNTIQLGCRNFYSLPSLGLFSYQNLILQKSTKFIFQTFADNWIIPTIEFTKGYIPLKTVGEFQSIDYKQNGTATSIIRRNDLTTLDFSNLNFPNVLNLGKMIRWGDEISLGFGVPINGQIIKINSKKLTIRLGTPFLASNRGIVHIFQNELIEKNQLLVTLKSRRLQTEDIVQGIPKIEQLFEARESQNGQILHDTVHTRLRNFFIYELENLEKNHWSIAVKKSFLQAQNFLVEGIIEAYGKQGVKISEKHVEVIVRQMTTRVRIIAGGETGLLPGELVDHHWIQIFNKQLKTIGLREATYEPIVLGISKSVLQSESFLLAASFQEVSRVLVKSALTRKRDFLRGLHENVIVGQLIPAGTGLLAQNQFNILNSKSTNLFTAFKNNI